MGRNTPGKDDEMNTLMNLRRISVEKLKPAKYNPRKDLRPGDPAYEKIKRSLHDLSLIHIYAAAGADPRKDQRRRRHRPPGGERGRGKGHHPSGGWGRGEWK